MRDDRGYGCELKTARAKATFSTAIPLNLERDLYKRVFAFQKVMSLASYSNTKRLIIGAAEGGDGRKSKPSL